MQLCKFIWLDPYQAVEVPISLMVCNAKIDKQNQTHSLQWLYSVYMEFCSILPLISFLDLKMLIINYVHYNLINYTQVQERLCKIYNGIKQRNKKNIV